MFVFSGNTRHGATLRNRAERIAEKIHALDWRDLQLWSIGFVVLVVVTGGFVALVTPQMLWQISAAIARQQNIVQLIFGEDVIKAADADLYVQKRRIVEFS